VGAQELALPEVGGLEQAWHQEPSQESGAGKGGQAGEQLQVVGIAGVAALPPVEQTQGREALPVERQASQGPQQWHDWPSAAGT